MKKNQMIKSMGKIDELLKDKRLLILFPILLGILFLIVLVKSNKTEDAANQESVNQAFLEPEAEGEEKLMNKIDAYKREKEDNARKRMELENSQVRGSDFYFDMQKEEEQEEKMKSRIEKMKRDPLDGVTTGYEDHGQNSFSRRMEEQLSEIEDKQTFNQIVQEAQKEERIRKELEETRKFREEMKRKYMAQSARKAEEPKDTFPKVQQDTLSVPESIFIVENGKRKRRSQLEITQKANLIKATIYGDQVIVSGSPVRMRLLEPLRIGGVVIPENTIFYGNASVGASRLRITVDNIRYGKYITPVSFTIFDSDAIEGLNLPNNMKAEAARKMQQGILQGVQLPISSIGTLTSEVTSAITATTQVAKQILNQSLSQVKVHLKANYNVFIKEETNEDRKKREAEDAELERMYQQMLIQQNEPQKKNPLTKLIESL